MKTWGITFVIILLALVGGIAAFVCAFVFDILEVLMRWRG
jgi:hypothetical protein